MTAWTFACPDWEERLRAGRSLVPDLPLDKAEAARAVDIFNKLRLPDVAGQPAMAEAAGDWFRDIVAAAFGSLDRDTGHRMVPELFALVPKKNSKTTGGAAIMVTALLMNRRPRAEMLFVGPTQDVADLAYEQAEGMIAADEYLARRFHVLGHRKMIRDRVNGAFVRVKTFDMKVMTGSKPVVVLVDELHVMSAYAYASRVIGQIRGGLNPNPESLLIFITTQSDQPPTGAFKAELGYARGVRDGRIAAARMLPILYEFPEAMQVDQDRPWRDPANWPMVLPNLGKSIHLERLVAEHRAAVERGEDEERRWASQHLNVQIGLALHADRWVGADYWEAAADLDLTLESLIERSEVIVAGIDGGGLDDLLGLAVLGRERGTRRWLVFARAWAHASVLGRRKSEAERLRDLERAGDVRICARLGDDIAELVGVLEQADRSGKLARVGLDPVGVGAIVDALADAGIGGELDAVGQDRVVGVSQGWKLTGAIKTTERKLADGTLVHAGQPLMDWCVGNAKVEPKGNAVMITKQASGTAKIDPLMAAFDAIALMSVNPEAPQHRITSEVIVARGGLV